MGLKKEREYFINNLAMLIGSGMNILGAVDGLMLEMHSRSMRRIVAQMKEDLMNGSPFWKVLGNSNMFSERIISLVRIGEQSGRLAENLELVAIQEEKDRILASKMRSAMMYPVLVLSLTLFIGVGIAWFILPRLATVFAQLKLELPLVTRVLISTGEFLGEYGLVAVPSILFSMLCIVYVVFFFSKTRFIGQELLFNVPGIGRLLQEVEMVRFGYLLGTLLQAGLPVTQSLSSLEEAATFSRYKKFYRQLRLSIEDGNSFQKSFEKYAHTRRCIAPSVQQLIVAGEQSGNLPKTLLKVSAMFEAKTETTTKDLSVILEPLLLIIVWLGVVAVALAVILPIYNLIGGLTSASSSPAPVASPVAPVVIEQVIVEELVSADVDQLFLTIADTTDFLNVRSAPSVDSEIIGQVYPGERYVYEDQVDSWYGIRFGDGANGWVSGAYVLIDDNVLPQ